MKYEVSKDNPYKIFIGKRKCSIVKVFAKNGTGKILINKVDINDFSHGIVFYKKIMEPLIITKSKDIYDFDIRVKGGGFSGQTDAIRHGISKFLASISLDWKAILKKNKFLVRDSRIKERKKYGLKKARKAPQFSKR